MLIAVLYVCFNEPKELLERKIMQDVTEKVGGPSQRSQINSKSNSKSPKISISFMLLTLMSAFYFWIYKFTQTNVDSYINEHTSIKAKTKKSCKLINS